MFAIELVGQFLKSFHAILMFHTKSKQSLKEQALLPQGLLMDTLVPNPS